MAFRLSRPGAVCVVACAAVLFASALDRLAPPPSADVARGSEEAFATGLYPRELPPRQAPQRWTTDRALVRFRRLPPGPAALEVGLHGQRGPVAVAAGGVVLGVMEPGVARARYAIPGGVAGALDVELRAETFVAADGRRLGALLDRVALEHAPPGVPTIGLLLCLLAPALCLVVLGMAAGLGPPAAALLAVAVAVLECLALGPCGLVRSGYARTLALLLVGGSAAASGFAAWARRGSQGAAPWAFVALLAAVLVQGIAATTPLMVVSDVVFHANKLASVGAGDFFPVSRTQHARPFTIPYGVSLYALLAPLYRAGFDGVTLVRGGAALAGVVASGALFLLLSPMAAPRAALAVFILQVMPGTFDIYSYGNLSNGFGQAVTVLFFAWWAGGASGGWPAGAGLLALGCVAHLSSLVVLVALGAALALARGRGLDRPRLAALGLGLGLACLYYFQFWPLVREQLPRLLEGGGQGRGASQSALGALVRQVLGALGQWGVPAIALAVLGRPRATRGGLDRDLAAFWIAGLLLAVPAVVSPLDVRYLYALTLPLSLAAASGFEALAAGGPAGRSVAWALLLGQTALGAAGIVEAVLHRYRPA